jgi:hypothetical protein
MTNDGIATSQLAVTGPVVDDGTDSDPPTSGGNSVPSVVNGDGQDVVVSFSTVTLTGNGDTIAGSGDTVNAAPNTTVYLDGTSDIVSGTGVVVNAADAFVTLTGANETLAGQRDIIALTGNAANITVNGDAQDIVYTPSANPGQLTLTGSNDVLSGPTNTQVNLQDGSNLIVVNGGSNVTVNGNNETINGQVNGLILTGSGDTVEGFSNIIELPDGSGVTLKNVGGYTTVYGNNEQINVPTANTAVVLMGSGDVVNGDDAVVQMPNGGSATLNGNNDQVYGANDILYVNNESIALGAINGGTNPLVGATIVGSNDQITMPVQDPTTTTSLTVQGTNDLLMGRGEAITIADGASIKYITTSGTTVTFAGPTGTLQLDGPGSFDPPEQNAVVGFGAQDQIDIGGLVYTEGTTGASYLENGDRTGGTLTVGNGTTSSSILLYGDYTTQNFALASDGHGGTLVTDPPTPTQTQLVQPTK